VKTVSRVTVANVGPCSVEVWTKCESSALDLLPDKAILHRLAEIDDTWQGDAELDVEDVVQLIINAMQTFDRVEAYEIRSIKKHGMIVMP
jgi:hypothetical protein